MMSGRRMRGYFDSLVHMFALTLKLIPGFDSKTRDGLIERVNEVRHTSHYLGFGVGDAMDELLDQHLAED